MMYTMYFSGKLDVIPISYVAICESPSQISSDSEWQLTNNDDYDNDNLYDVFL